MPSSAPGASSRGRGGKFKKYTRGGTCCFSPCPQRTRGAWSKIFVDANQDLLTIGGRSFSRDLQPADEDGNKVSMWSEDANNNIDEDSEEDSDEDSEEESEDEKAEASREDRKAQKKARKEAAIAKTKAKTVEVGDLPSSDEDSDDDDMPANPNHSKASRNQAGKAGGVDAITAGVANMKAPGNRKEREALEAQAAKERYLKLQGEGKTDQAKADLARLKLIREQREAESARRQVSKDGLLPLDPGNWPWLLLVLWNMY